MSEVRNRVVFAIIMAYGVFACLTLGTLFLLPFILVCMVSMFFEILRINHKARKDRQMHYFRILPWYFLIVTEIATIGYVMKDRVVATFPFSAQYFERGYFGVTVFSLYTLGFVGFVMSLRRGLYRYQFRQFAWIGMTLLLIVVTGSLQLANITHGIFWFAVPVSAVTINDIYAYLCGKSFGRTPLLRLSPKKTLEGFIGAWFFTTIWTVWFTGALGQFECMVCPTFDLTTSPTCDIPLVYQRQPLQFPRPTAANLQSIPLVIQSGSLSSFQDTFTLQVAPIQLHAIVIAAFASLIAPFGGFFASGLKRAFQLKDFGDLIPGHGGMTDRNDCQIIMGLFTYFYIQIFIIGQSDGQCPGTVEGLLECVRHLSPGMRLQFTAAMEVAFRK